MRALPKPRSRTRDASVFACICLIALATIASSHLLIDRNSKQILRSEAEQRARNWAIFLARANLDDGPMTSHFVQSERELELVRNAMQAEQIFLFKLFDSSGRLIFASDPSLVDATTLANHNQAAAEAAMSGAAHVRLFTGVQKANHPTHFSEAYVPIEKDPRIVGVAAVYVDQSERYAELEAQSTFLSLTVGLIVAIAVGAPSFLFIHRSLQIARAEKEQQVQNARFAAAIECMPHGFSMFDGQNRLVTCNTRYQRMYGFPDRLTKPGTPVVDMVTYAVAVGLIETKNAVMANVIHRPGVDETVEDSTWHLNDGRIISVAVSYMADGGRVAVHMDATERHRTAARIAESEARFKDFASAAGDWCWETDAEHRFTFLTEGFQFATGVDPAAVVGRRLEDISLHKGDAEARATYQELTHNRAPLRDHYIHVRRTDGLLAYIKSSANPRFSPEGEFLGYRGTSRDVTAEEAGKAELRKAEDALLARTRQLVEAQRIGRMGDWSYTVGAPHHDWCPELYELLRFEPGYGPITQAEVLSRCIGDGAALVAASHRESKGTQEARTVDIKFRCGDGSIIDCAVTSKATMDANGRVVTLSGTVQDITDRKRAEEQLERLAFYDPLTGLANRSFFTRRLEALVAERSADENGAALLLLDLDGFKDVNDSLGHASGDQLLAKVGAVVSGELKDGQDLARLGGDEFGIIVGHSGGIDDVTELAQRIVNAVSGTIVLDHGEVMISTSIGIAFIDTVGLTAATLLRNADLALYKAKEAGRGRYELFRQEMDAALRHKVLLDRELRRAVSDGIGLSVHYQPLFDLAKGRVSGFEALARWTHPELGSISPAQFIPIAEGSQLILDLGRWVLRQAAGQMKAWIDAGETPREISVNVSAAQIWHSDLAGDVARILEETGLPPHLLCLELTESLLADPGEKRVRTELAKLKDLGLQLALDDFGTDYSSLGYLTQLPFDKLKIDRVFVDGVATSARRRELLKGIIALGHGLGMTVVGEGAEKLEEVELLAALGCDVAQGYVLSRPLPAQQAINTANTLQPPRMPNAVHQMQQTLLASCLG